MYPNCKLYSWMLNDVDSRKFLRINFIDHRNDQQPIPHQSLEEPATPRLTLQSVAALDSRTSASLQYHLCILSCPVVSTPVKI